MKMYENYPDIIETVINGQWTNAKKKLRALNLADQEQFIRLAHETKDEHGLALCRSLLIDLI